MNMQIYSMLQQINDVLGETLDNDEKTNFLLDLLVWRKISLDFEEVYQEIRSSTPGNEEKIEEYSRRGILYLPLCSRWKTVQESINHSCLKDCLYSALSGIINEVPQFHNIASADSVIENINNKQLRHIIKILSTIPYDTKLENSDLLMFFEILMGRYAIKESSSQLGEFYAPSSVVQLLVELIQPKQGNIYDPCCGSGGMLLYAAEYLAKNNVDDFKLYGQEANESAWNIAKTNLLLHGLDVDLGEKATDIFRQDIHSNVKADYVLSNPPFGNRKWGRDILINDPRWKYGVPPKNNGSFAWLQHMLYHLNERGKMGIILSMSSLSSYNVDEKEIRSNLIRNDLIETIITLPPKLFYNTTIPVSIWVLNKKKHPLCKNQVLFVDASKLGTADGRFTVLDSQSQAAILYAYHAYQKGKFELKPDFYHVATVKDIEAQEYTLLPKIYIRSSESETLTKQELDTKEQELIHDLHDLMSKNNDIINSIFNT